MNPIKTHTRFSATEQLRALRTGDKSHTKGSCTGREDAGKSSLPNTGPEQWQEVIMKVMGKGTYSQNILYTCVEMP